MAQTPTTLRTGAPVHMGGAAGSGALRLCSINIANSANETSHVQDWSAATFGLTSVVPYGCTPRDATAGVPYADLSGTTVTYTWTNDVLNIVCWAIGY